MKTAGCRYHLFILSSEHRLLPPVEKPHAHSELSICIQASSKIHVLLLIAQNDQGYILLCFLKNISMQLRGYCEKNGYQLC